MVQYGNCYKRDAGKNNDSDTRRNKRVKFWDSNDIASEQEIEMILGIAVLYIHKHHYGPTELTWW